MASGTAYDRAHFRVPGLVHEELVQTSLAEHVEAGEHPGRAQLAHAQGAALIVGLAVAARYLLQGIAGVAAVVAADGVDGAALAEHVAVDLLGASRGGDAAVGRWRHRGGPGRNGHRGRCHPAIPSTGRSRGRGGAMSRRPPTVLISGARGFRSSSTRRFLLLVSRCFLLPLFFSPPRLLVEREGWPRFSLLDLSSRGA